MKILQLLNRVRDMYVEEVSLSEDQENRSWFPITLLKEEEEKLLSQFR